MISYNLAKKLRIQPGQRALFINAPEGYLEALNPLPEDVRLQPETDQNMDFVQLFVKNNAELENMGEKAVDAVKYDGLLWVSYPKKSSKLSSDISRDAVWQIMEQWDVRPVTQISIDETWSALRFRPPDKVGK
ncbi:MAG TPA: hypothetical protein VIK64_13130 [Anaerolineales bacterium]